MNVNGSKTENAAEEMLYFFNKLDYAYFNSGNVEIHTEDYSYEDTNININVPLEVKGELELTGNINLSTGIKALEDVNLNGEVKNTNESVICSETGDIIINTTNVNLNGLVYAPEGCVDITAQNLNMNNVIIIADTIKVECPNLNANYSNSMGEFIGTESEVDLELFAYGEYISESNSINVFWNTTVPKGTFNVQISYDNEAYTSVGTVTDVESYSYAISEEFEKMYIKVTETTNYGESYDAVPFVVRKAEDGYMIDFLDSDEDDLPDIFEIEIGTNIDISDSDEDGLTDYQEVYFTDTDPTVYDSVTEGIRDADIDSDGDGLSNIFELENEIDPLLEDTDDDGLSDYDEIYVYGTNPAIPDTDEDNIEDGAEIKLGLDTNNPETFGVPDAEYSIEQQIEADSSVMSEVNTEENPYEFSLELKTNGYAEDNLIVSRSGYASVIENEAMLGISTDVEIDSSCNPENIVLKYTIKNEYLDNTLGIYTDCEEFQGIKRLNVFKYFEDINMLLPIETQFDADNNLVYAEVDELGTYCIMDMEIWLNSLGVEPAAEEVNIDLSDIELNYDNDISLLASYSEEYKFNGNKYLICNQRGSWTNCQEACVNSGGHLLTIDSQEEQDFIMSILDEDCRPFYWLGGRKTNDNWQWVTNEPFVYSNFSSVKPEGELSGDCLRIYGRDMGGVAKGEWSDTVDYCAIVTSDYSEYYGGFICEWEGTPSDEENDDNNSGNESDGAEDNTENEGVTYECLVATKWKTIKLKDVLNASNGVNSDTDSLTDWQEVNTKLLKWNDDGSFELPTFKEIFTVADIALNFQRYYGTVYEIPINNVFYREVLPVLSDPTEEDSDGDGLRDDEDSEPLKIFLNELLEKIKLMEKYIDEYFEYQYIYDKSIYDDDLYINTPNSTVAINIIRNLYYGSEKIIKENITLEDYCINLKQQFQWYITDGTSFPSIRKYIDEKDASLISYFKKYRNSEIKDPKLLIDNEGNKIDFLHLLATLGAERYDGIIDPDLAGWAGDLQSFIYNFKLETYGKEYDYNNLTKTEKLTEIAYDMLTGTISVNKNKFSNEDLLSDVDAKNINEIYSENLNLSSALRGYYTKHYNSRFTNFISCYNGIDEFYGIVGEYTKGHNPIKHMLLNKSAKDTMNVKKVKEIYEASYIREIQGIPIYSLPHPRIVTEEESIALRDGFCRWIELKLSEETKEG